MQYRLMLEISDGGSKKTVSFMTCLGFSFEKALYVPYTKFSGIFYADGAPEFTAAGVTAVRFVLDGREIHYGMPDKVSIEKSVYGYRLRVTSRGYTLLLAQNEPYPRINSNVDLVSLCTGNLDCDKIIYEEPTPTVGNIYVKEGSTVWEAAVAYCIKASGRYPYIKGANQIYMNLRLVYDVDYTDCIITEEMNSSDSSMILSDVYMRELGEDYPFEAHDGAAAEKGIVRSRYYPLDMQWLFDPQVGLQHKLDHSNRGSRVFGMTYEGWKKEDLMYKAVGGGAVSGMRINFIRIVGSKKGIFTTVRAYDDRYGQK